MGGQLGEERDTPHPRVGWDAAPTAKWLSTCRGDTLDWAGPAVDGRSEEMGLVRASSPETDGQLCSRRLGMAA